MDADPIEFTAELFRWADGNWFFVRLPGEAAEHVRDHDIGPPRGFGSVRVEVSLGATTWSTSVFPEKETESFVLPVKKAVPAAEELDEGDLVVVSLSPIGP